MSTRPVGQRSKNLSGARRSRDSKSGSSAGGSPPVVEPCGAAGSGTSGEAGVGGKALVKAGDGGDGDPGMGILGGAGGRAELVAGSAGVHSGLSGGDVTVKAGNGDSIPAIAAAGEGGDVLIKKT